MHRSEPESQLVRHVATQLSPHAWINVHSGMEAMFVPWDHKGEVRGVRGPQGEVCGG